MVMYCNLIKITFLICWDTKQRTGVIFAALQNIRYIMQRPTYRGLWIQFFQVWKLNEKCFSIHFRSPLKIWIISFVLICFDLLSHSSDVCMFANRVDKYFGQKRRLWNISRGLGCEFERIFIGSMWNSDIRRKLLSSPVFWSVRWHH